MSRNVLSDETLDHLNGEIIEGLAAMLTAIEEHEAVVSARDALAHAHGLATPGRRRFLFPAPLLRSRASDILRDRLRIEYGTGGIAERPTQGAPPIGMVPSA